MSYLNGRGDTCSADAMRFYVTVDILAALAASLGDLGRARTLGEDGVARFRHLGDPRGLACELAPLGRILPWRLTMRRP
jgi:hypothetical protein